jgi:hypothetical protein
MSTGAAYPILLDADGAVAASYGVVSSPTVVRIAKGGSIER